MKNFARSHHSGLHAHSLWEKIFIYRRNEFKNVCLMTEIVFSLSTSNSMVERAFSLLILVSDKRLSLEHETIESLIKINLSDKIRTEKEQNGILERAVHVYLRKWGGKNIAEPPKKVSGMECDNENTQKRLSESHEEDKVVLLTDPDSEVELQLFYLFYIVAFNLFFGLSIDFVLAFFVFNILVTF